MSQSPENKPTRAPFTEEIGKHEIGDVFLIARILELVNSHSRKGEFYTYVGNIDQRSKSFNHRVGNNLPLDLLLTLRGAGTSLVGISLNKDGLDSSSETDLFCYLHLMNGRLCLFPGDKVSEKNWKRLHEQYEKIIKAQT